MTDLSPPRIWLALGILFLFRIALASLLPITGDEAYFVLWGRFPDFGFYDHPPMVGWWMSALLAISDAPLWLRLPSVLLPPALAVATYFVLKHSGQERAKYAGLFVLLAPANVWNVLITTDTPLVLFGVLSSLAFIRAFQTERLLPYFLCALLFAGAVLSKYFAALLGIAFAVATLLAPTRRRFAGLLLIGFLMLPALALMGWWNAENCWPNILFNLVNRNTRAGFHWQQPAMYGLMMAYMLGFLPIWFGLRRPSWLIPWKGTSEDRMYWALSWVPLILFALLSFSKQIGLHWVLTFVPLTLLGLLRHLSVTQAQLSIRWLALLGLVHMLILGVLGAIPLERWKDNSRYPEIVWTLKTSTLVEAAGIKNESDRLWFTDGYTYSAELSYARDRTLGRLSTYGGEHVGVFGPGSHYARQDDRLTDFNALDGKNFGIVLRSAPAETEYVHYFRHIKIEPFQVAGATFYRVLGDGFLYATYRDKVLKPIQDRFYQFPNWLPDCGCFFGKRYFAGESPAG
ncbi:MAG: hypothetical protein RIR18_454 [Pseudomonadota bacterium]|jgi:hypothetical protein